MKVTTLAYKGFMALYQGLPFKRSFCIVLRALPFPKEKLYKDLKFSGVYTVPVNEHAAFKLTHHSSTIENEIFWKGLGNSWEEDTIWIWKILAKDAHVIFDIGANTGVYTLMAKALHPGCKVYGFEPIKRTYNRYCENVSNNGYTDVTCENIALSNFDGEAVIYDPEVDTQTSASLNPDKLKNDLSETSKINEYKIAVQRLDTYVKNNHIKGIDLIKMDVEMYEPQVVNGCKELLFQYKPAIIIEVLTAEVAEKLNSVFVGSGYRIFHLSGKDKMVECSRMSAVPNLWNYLLCSDATASKLTDYIH